MTNIIEKFKETLLESDLEKTLPTLKGFLTYDQCGDCKPSDRFWRLVTNKSAELKGLAQDFFGVGIDSDDLWSLVTQILLLEINKLTERVEILEELTERLNQKTDIFD